MTVADAVEHTNVNEQLRYETVERRQSAYSNYGKEHQNGGYRHMLCQATHLIHCRGVQLRVDVTRAEKEH